MKRSSFSRRLRASCRRSDALPFLLILVLVVGIIWVAQPVLVPLVVAVLLAFILNPLVNGAQRLGLKRVPAVLGVVVVTLLVLAAVAWGVFVQVGRFASELPSHGEHMRAKIARLQKIEIGSISRVRETARTVFGTPEASPERGGESRAGSEAGTTPSSEAPPAAGAAPATSAGWDIGRLMAAAGVVAQPVASAGLIAILVPFILIRREDLRNRIIGLLGQNRLTGTTRVLVSSAERLSRLLLVQLLINTGFGIIFGAALFFLGVPYWFLWGFLTVWLSFIPFIGSWIAVAMPLVVSVAISPGWVQPLLILAIFVVADFVRENVVEPWLLGRSTGVSEVALVIAAVFWTWVWGPMGLLLSSPLTVCLVVLGQHVPRLQFLSLLLGNEPALEPHLGYYQRLLAGDRDEALAIAQTYAAEAGRDRTADNVFLPTLLLARRDRRQAGLTPDDEQYILDSTAAVLERLAETPGRRNGRPGGGGNGQEEPTAAADGAVADQRSPAAAVVFGCPAHDRAEELVLRMMEDQLGSHGIRLEVVSSRALHSRVVARIEKEKPDLAFVAVMPPDGVTQALSLCERLRERMEDLVIVVGWFGAVRDFDKLLSRFRAAGASYVTTSVLQSQKQIRALVATEKEGTGGEEPRGSEGTEGTDGTEGETARG